MEQNSSKYERLENIVDSVNNSEISSIRNVVSGIIRIIEDPKSTGKDLKEIIEVDPPLTARVLRRANSAYYAPPHRIAEILKAIVWIGWDAIKELALSQKVCEIFNNDELIHGYSRISLWKHSLAVALFGKLIYRREFAERGENIYVAGLLHDIGLIIEDQFFHNEFTNILKKSREDGKNLMTIENDILGCNHAEIGKALSERWNLPTELCTALGNHHDPFKDSQENSKMTYTLFVAETFCQERAIGYGDAPFHDKAVFNRCLMKLGIDRHALNLIAEDMEREISRMEAQGFFNSWNHHNM